jgi:hypothetical protein
MSWSIHDAVELAKMGIPAIVICTSLFETMARITAKNLGFTAIPLVATQHPIGGLNLEEIKLKGRLITEKLISLLS